MHLEEAHGESALGGSPRRKCTWRKPTEEVHLEEAHGESALGGSPWRKCTWRKPTEEVHSRFIVESSSSSSVSLMTIVPSSDSSSTIVLESLTRSPGTNVAVTSLVGL